MISLNVRHILSVMPFYAVAKGRQIGIYKSWGECEKVVKGFMGAKYRKFDEEEDAINFIQLYGSEAKEKAQMKGNSDGNYSCSSLYKGIRPVLSQGDKIPFPKSLSQESSASSKSATSMSDVPEIEKSPLPKSLSQKSPRVSTPKLKVDALKQRMMLLENMYFKSMLELRSEIDSTKERIASVCASIDADGEAGDAENIKTLQDCVSELAKHYRETVSELKEEIESLKETVKTLDLGQKNVETEKASTSAMSSFKRNLFKEALEPVATKRLYSNKAGEKSILGKRKNTDSDYGECSKVIKQEPLAYDECDSDKEKFLLTGFEVDEDGYVQVYTDGACEKNGRVGAKAGVGVWFGNNNPLNYSEPVQGRTTNNTAEIQAATCAVDLARKAGIKNLKIHTDSQFLINCITIWIHKWKKKGWKVADGSQVKNKEDLIALDQAMEGMNIRWNHVRGHRGNYGNEMADQLARAGAKKSYR